MTDKFAVSVTRDERPDEMPEEHEDLVLAPERGGARSRAWGSPPVGYPWQPEDAPEVATLEETALRALEARLADVRRLLLSAGRVRSPFRTEVEALQDLAGDLHHRVLAEIAEANGAARAEGTP